MACTYRLFEHRKNMFFQHAGRLAPNDFLEKIGNFSRMFSVTINVKSSFSWYRYQIPRNSADFFLGITTENIPEYIYSVQSKTICPMFAVTYSRKFDQAISNEDFILFVVGVISIWRRPSRRQASFCPALVLAAVSIEL